MKAYNLHSVNDLSYEEVPMPQCASGWAIVKVKAAGICSSDISRVFTKGTYHFPTIPGHEFSGVVESVADTEDKKWIGKHVGVFPLIPCRKCRPCADKHYEMCENYDYIGSRRDGAFAEYVAVPVWNLIEIPDNMPFEVAAMLEPFSVALHAIKFGQVSAQDRVAIIGTGMIGIAAGLWAGMRNAGQVTIIGRSEQKRHMIEKFGLEYQVLNESARNEYDFILEAVGTPASIESAINATRRGGRLVLMGNPSGDILLHQNIYWKILRKQLVITGTWNSSYDGTNPSDWTDVVEALAAQKIDGESLITHRFRQERLMEGLELMKEHKEPYCKVMTLWNE